MLPPPTVFPLLLPPLLLLLLQGLLQPPGAQGQLPWRVHSIGLLTHAMHCSMLLMHHEQLLLLVHVHSCCLLLLLHVVHESSLVHIWRSHTCWGQMRRSHVLWLHEHWGSKGWLHGGSLWMTHTRSHVAVHGCMRSWAMVGGRRGLAPNTRRAVRRMLAPSSRRRVRSRVAPGTIRGA